MKHILVNIKNNELFFSVVVGVIYVACALLFAKGFLLNRVELYEHQKCTTVEPSVIETAMLGLRLGRLQSVEPADEDVKGNSVKKTKPTCMTFSRFQKAVLIVVDALRHDFTVFNHNKNESTTKPYENKLSVIDNLLAEKPHNSLLLKFIADPPTTTMQRLKGLTTGSLPTFVDAGKNFASSEIGEDNLIYQMDRMGKRIIFMGDDTWESLYKKYFTKSYPFPSFNVKDLHTVDNGCIANLFPVMEQENWDVIIAHFLGVDHCGHRFGPDHPAMAEKLLQINSVIQSVIEKLPKDSVLFVLGDHGMTKTGDHGGDSADEVNAALFVYSPSQLRSKALSHHQDYVAQIDLVPTVALLLGLPIPFSNLGRIIPDLFSTPIQMFETSLKNLSQSIKADLSYVCALDRNVRQVKNYIEMYHNLTGAFPTSLLFESEAMFKKVDSIINKIASSLESERDLNFETLKEDLVLTGKLLTSYLSFIREMCRKMWAQFDDFSINVGVCTLLGMLLINLLPLFHISVHYSHVFLLQFTFLIFQWNTIQKLTLQVAANAIVSLILQRISQKTKMLNDPTRTWKSSIGDIFIGILCCTHSISLASNSYVLYEGYAISYLISSIVTFVFIGACAQIKPPLYAKKRFILGKFPIMTFSLLLFLFLSRLGQLFWSCRMEQPKCDVSLFLIPLSTLQVSASSRIVSLRYLISGISVIAPVLFMKRWFSKSGNLEIPFGRTFAINYGLPLAAICIFLYWALLAVPSSLLDKMPPWQHTFLPQIAYSMLIVSFVSIMAHPVCVYILSKEEGRKVHEVSQNTDDGKRKISSKSRFAASKRYGATHLVPPTVVSPKPKNDGPVVCGLGTVYSANALQFIVTFYLLVSLLLGDGLALPMVLMAAQMSILFAVRTLAEGEGSHKIPYVPVWLIAVWSLMSMQYFFTTGHQATIPSIRFETAFIGFHGNYPSYLYWIPALMILLNTFASQVMFAAALPHLLLWPLTQRNKTEDGMRGELELQLDPGLLKRRLSHLIMHYISFQALQLFGTMLSAAIHQRHLMAWSIFAPRFIFQGVGFLMTLPTLAISCGILMFTHHSLTKWIDKHLK